MRVRLAVLALLFAAPAAAQTMPMPVDIQLPLFLKILTYDRSFQYKARSAITIGIIYLPGDPASVKAKDEMVANLQRLADRTIKNLPIKHVVLEFKDVASLDKAVKAAKVNVFYVAPGLGEMSRYSPAGSRPPMRKSREGTSGRRSPVAASSGCWKASQACTIRFPEKVREASSSRPRASMPSRLAMGAGWPMVKPDPTGAMRSRSVVR
jgi:hypothetical protein